mmetsp:Transcript_42603/g.89380  ORF Transcript_42603/g.89380 Transcript_42603/m.89380 type:complete len:1294 (+) Transcript_42603:105-3986(+)
MMGGNSNDAATNLRQQLSPPPPSRSTLNDTEISAQSDQSSMKLSPKNYTIENADRSDQKITTTTKSSVAAPSASSASTVSSNNNSAQLDWHTEMLCGLFLRSDERELEWLEREVEFTRKQPSQSQHNSSQNKEGDREHEDIINNREGKIDQGKKKSQKRQQQRTNNNAVMGNTHTDETDGFLVKLLHMGQTMDSTILSLIPEALRGVTSTMAGSQLDKTFGRNYYGNQKNDELTAQVATKSGIPKNAMLEASSSNATARCSTSHDREGTPHHGDSGGALSAARINNGMGTAALKSPLCILEINATSDNNNDLGETEQNGHGVAAQDQMKKEHQNAKKCKSSEQREESENIGDFDEPLLLPSSWRRSDYARRTLPELERHVMESGIGGMMLGNNSKGGNNRSNGKKNGNNGSHNLKSPCSRNEAENCEVFTLLYNECSLSAMANWSMLDCPIGISKDEESKERWEKCKQEQEKRRATDKKRYQVIIPQPTFHLCGVCGGFGHYEAECEILTGENKRGGSKRTRDEVLKNPEAEKKEKSAHAGGGSAKNVIDEEFSDGVIASLSKEIHVQRRQQQLFEDYYRQKKKGIALEGIVNDVAVVAPASVKKKRKRKKNNAEGIANDVDSAAPESDKKQKRDNIGEGIVNDTALAAPESDKKKKNDTAGEETINDGATTVRASAKKNDHALEGIGNNVVSAVQASDKKKKNDHVAKGIVNDVATANPASGEEKKKDHVSEENIDDVALTTPTSYNGKSSCCKICNSTFETAENVMILCDGCDELFHCKCLDPPLDRVPEGDWFCSNCISHDSDVSSIVEIEGCGEFVIEQRKRSVAEEARECSGVSLGQSKSTWTVALSLLPEQDPVVEDELYLRKHLGRERGHRKTKFFRSELCWAKRFDDQLGRLVWWPGMVSDFETRSLKSKSKTTYTVKFFALDENAEIHETEILPFMPHYEGIGHKRLMRCDNSGHETFRRALILCISTLGLKSLGQTLKVARNGIQIATVLDDNNQRLLPSGWKTPVGWESANIHKVDGIVILAREGGGEIMPPTSFSHDIDSIDDNFEAGGTASNHYSIGDANGDNNLGQESFATHKMVAQFSVDEIVGGVVSWQSSFGTSCGSESSHAQYGIVVSIDNATEMALVRSMPALSEASSGKLDELFHNESKQLLIHASNIGSTIWIPLRHVRFVSGKPSSRHVAKFRRKLKSNMSHEMESHASQSKKDATYREEYMVELQDPSVLQNSTPSKNNVDRRRSQETKGPATYLNKPWVSCPHCKFQSQFLNALANHVKACERVRAHNT